MSVDPQRAAWLRDELMEALDAMGHVGLYEALWTINGASLDLSRREARELARAVVEALLGEPASGLRLRRLSWPGAEARSEALPVSALDDDSSWVEGETYVALVRAEAAPR